MNRAILGISMVLAVMVFGGCEQRAAQQQEGALPETAANPAAPLVEQTDWTSAATDQGVLSEEALTGESAALPPQTTSGQITTSGTFVKPSVQEIQQALKNLNLYQGNIDGKLGPKTKQAVKDFQAQNNLSVDGKVGPRTWAQLAPYVNMPTATDEASIATVN